MQLQVQQQAQLQQQQQRPSLQQQQQHDLRVHRQLTEERQGRQYRQQSTSTTMLAPSIPSQQSALTSQNDPFASPPRTSSTVAAQLSCLTASPWKPPLAYEHPMISGLVASPSGFLLASHGQRMGQPSTVPVSCLSWLVRCDKNDKNDNCRQGYQPRKLQALLKHTPQLHTQ
jgi:hypothetical protein